MITAIMLRRIFMILVVPKEGIEPPLRKELIPKTSASTYSATWAYLILDDGLQCRWMENSNPLVCNAPYLSLQFTTTIFYLERVRGIEPLTFCMASRRSTN